MAWREQVSIEETVQFLNELAALDRAAIEALVEHRVVCNEALTDHPTVQVQAWQVTSAHVGMLGVLNGLFGIDETGWGPITAVFDDDGALLFFKKTDVDAGREVDDGEDT